MHYVWQAEFNTGKYLKQLEQPAQVSLQPMNIINSVTRFYWLVKAKVHKQ